MLPPLCHVVSDCVNDDYLKSLCTKYPFISCSDTEQPGMPNIFYSFKLANATMLIDVDDYTINDTTYWIHSKNEFGFNEQLVESLICDIHEASNNLEYEPVELILDGWSLDKFLMKLNGPPIIHSGDYEIYIVNSSDGKTYSFQKDEMKYCDIDPKEFLETIYYRLNYNFYVYSSIEIDDKFILNNYNPIYIQDLILSYNIEYIEYIDIINRYKLNKNIDKKYYVYLIYRVLQKILLVKENSKEKCKLISHYKRSVQTIKAERIYSSRKIHFNDNIKNICPPIHANLDDENSLAIEYIARNKRTVRMFTKPNEVLNLVNLSNSDISDKIVTSSPDNIFLSLDFKSFEFSILSNILGESIPADLHSVVAEGLCIPRSEAKTLSARIIYSRDFPMLRGVLTSLSKIQRETYLDILGYDFMRKLLELKASLEKEYDEYGYVVNTYGRKIKPKSKAAALNNYIQSIASEMMIDLTCKLYDLDYMVLFQRFDAIYIELLKPYDMHKQSIISIMETIGAHDIYTVYESTSKNLTDLLN